MSDTPRLLVLDHRDSFVFLLVEQFARLGARVRTLRTDIGLDALQAEVGEHDPHLVLLSPGPGHPADAGVMGAFLASDPRRPVLGVCLGHQALALAAGGEVGRAARPVHGKASVVEHVGGEASGGLFEGVPDPLRVARYHSLCVTRVPDAYQVLATARDEPDLVMAMRHRERPWIGLQFHPESVLTPHGARLVQNLLDSALAFDSAHPLDSTPALDSTVTRGGARRDTARSPGHGDDLPRSRRPLS